MWQADIIRLMQEARAMNQDMRFGQVLFNAIAMHDGRGDGYDENFHTRLYYIEDYELAAIMKEWFEWVEGQRKKA